MRRLVASLVLVLLCSTARSTDIAGPLATLDGAIQTRIAAIGSPAPDKVQARESTKLAKAHKQIGKFTGVIDVPGVTALIGAGKALEQSATSDAGIQDAVASTIFAIVACFQEQDQTFAQRVTDAIYTLADQDKARALLESARADLAAANTLAATDPAGALQALANVALKYGKASKFIEKTIVRLESAPQPRFRDPLIALNSNGKKYTISSVTFDVLFTPAGGGTPMRLTFDMKNYDDATGFVLPYKLVDKESECEIYPAFHAGLAALLGASPDGGRVTGSMRFISTKHGVVDVPLDEFISAP